MLFYLSFISFQSGYHQDASRYGFGWFPRIALHQHKYGMHHIQFCYLLRTSVQVMDMVDSSIVYTDPLFEPTPYVIVTAKDYNPTIFACERNGAIISIIGKIP